MLFSQQLISGALAKPAGQFFHPANVVLVHGQTFGAAARCHNVFNRFTLQATCPTT